MHQNDSSYFLDADSLIEASRLINQEKFLTETVALLPPAIDGKKLLHVLDIGCGPGGWLLDLAATYPQIQGDGVDVSESMLQMARLLSCAEERKLTFTWMDVRNGLAFPDDSFDFVQMRLNHSFLLPHMWAFQLQECFRVLQPGGFLRVIDLEIILTNKPETEEYHDLMPITWSKAKLCFSPTGRSMGILAQLKPLLRQAGFRDQQIGLHPLDASYGEKHYALALENLKVIFAGTRDTLVRAGGYAPEYLLGLYQTVLNVMQQEDFTCIAILFSNCSQKPSLLVSRKAR